MPIHDDGTEAAAERALDASRQEKPEPEKPAAAAAKKAPEPVAYATKVTVI